MGYKKCSDEFSSDEFKRDVLAMVAEGRRSVAQLERDLGITAGRVYKRQLCAGLQVSASGFYDWLKRTPSRGGGGRARRVCATPIRAASTPVTTT